MKYIKMNKTKLLAEINKDYGFWGTCKGNYGISNKEMSQLWSKAINILIQVFKMKKQEVEEFLNSKTGRKFSDELHKFLPRDKEFYEVIDLVKAIKLELKKNKNMWLKWWKRLK